MMSPIQHFNTAPPVGSANRFTALVYGDMGISPIPRAYKTADYATEEANNGTAAFVFHNGDISYARGFVSSVTNSVDFPFKFCCKFFVKTWPTFSCIYCGSISSLVQILISFVSNSLSYITIPKNKRK